jgi:hypothetical protein
VTDADSIQAVKESLSITLKSIVYLLIYYQKKYMTGKAGLVLGYKA